MAETQMLNYVSAIGAAINEEMRRDERVAMWGEDLVSMQGAYGENPGMFKEFGDRIKDTPIVEQAILGTGMGAALAGIRPIVWLMTAGFLTIAFEGLFMEVGGLRQEYGYAGPMPLVVYCRSGIGGGFGAHHCASTESLFMHSPGLKIVMPSTAYDAKGLMKTAIRDDEPVIYVGYGALYFGAKEPIPTEEYLIPFGKADIKREGKDITIVCYSGMVRKALAAAEELNKEGISVEVVDLRTLVPMDVAAIVKSVEKTGRLLIAHEAMKRAGAAGEIAFRVTEAAPDLVKSLKTPIKRLAAQNLAIPRSISLDAQLLPQVEDVIAIVKTMGFD
ncbi:MAG: transketolase C-terminal domain-containing protein [Dehalococcoidales bacterium]|nr:transketolase C-terminal domain-containing protein [Dehalococcoidales bacterium]